MRELFPRNMFAINFSQGTPMPISFKKTIQVKRSAKSPISRYFHIKKPDCLLQATRLSHKDPRLSVPASRRVWLWLASNGFLIPVGLILT